MDAQTPTPANLEVEYWIREVEAAQKRQQKWVETATKVVKIYEGRAPAENSFNILYSNTETLLPALYNATPKPVVTERFQQNDDQLSKAVAEVVKRGLEYVVDSPQDKYTPFDQLMESAVLGGLVPGRGITWYSYDAEVEEDTKPEKNDPVRASKKDSTDTAQPSQEAPVPEPKPAQVLYETVCGRDIRFDRLTYGYARSWAAVQWVCLEHEMTRADLRANFGRELAEDIPMRKRQGDKRATDDSVEEEESTTAEVAPVYEIWDKSKRRVVFVAPDFKDRVLKRIDDPLTLPGFFPTPRPLQFLQAAKNSLDPLILYSQYQQQARELNRITQRINKLIEALKVRGLYHAALEELNELMNKEDNTLIPAKKAPQIAEQGGLEKWIWTVPIDKIITVVQQLYQQREGIKMVIYEITGISDIIRGSTKASETLGAQELKSQWGTMRLRRAQRRVAQYVRESFRIMAILMGKHYDIATWEQVTGLKFGRLAEKQQAQQAVQQVQAQMQAAQQDPQMMQNPQAQQAMQQVQQQLQELQQKAQMVTWEEIVQVLQNDLYRGYRIDIEANSTVDPEAVEDQKAVTEMIGALGQTLQSMGPLMQMGVPPALMKGLVLAISRKYKFGTEVESLWKMIPEQAPQQQGPDPAQVQKMQEEAEKAAQDAEFAKKELAMEQKAFEREKQMALKEIDMAKKMMLKEIEFAKKMAGQTLQMQQRETTAEIGMERQEAEAGLAQRAREQEMVAAQSTARRDLEFQGREQKFKNDQVAAKQQLQMQRQQVKPNGNPKRR